MNIRAINLHDYNKVKEIHENFYKEEFPLPDFLDKYLCAFVVEDEKGIICVGGVKTILESVIITDKNREFHDKLKALGMVRDASCFISQAEGYNELHAFIQSDKSWKQWLQKAGFKPTKGQAFVVLF